MLKVRKPMEYAYLIAAKAVSSASIRSSICSVPIESLMVFGFMPCSRSSDSVSCECVVEAGWITSDFTSATFASSENISRLSIKRNAASLPPFISNVKMLAPPFGKYFS